MIHNLNHFVKGIYKGVAKRSEVWYIQSSGVLFGSRQAIRRSRQNCARWPVGSYITRRSDPSDVVMAVLTPGVYQKAGEQKFTAEGIDLQLLDLCFAHDQADFQQWQVFFSLARAQQPKGIILLTF